MGGDADGTFRMICTVIVVMERLPQEGEEKKADKDE